MKFSTTLTLGSGVESGSSTNITTFAYKIQIRHTLVHHNLG